MNRPGFLAGGSLALLVAAVGCAGAAPGNAASTRAAVEAVNAASDPGTQIATVPASAPGVSTWNVYAGAQADGKPTLTVLGLDDTGQLVAGAVLLPDESVAGVGSSSNASESDAQAIGAAIAADVNGYIGAPGSTTSTSSVHVLGNPFGLSNCTYDVLSALGSIAGTVSGTVGAFATCPVSVGVGCVAGVVMTVAGAPVGVYNVDNAIHACSGPTPVAACQAACGSIGTGLPSCMTEDPVSSCYADCVGGSDDDTLTSFASCIQAGLSASGGGGGSATDDAGAGDAGPDDCQPLVGCFSVF